MATLCWLEIQILEEVVEQDEAETATSRNEIINQS
jgi:hypothetical protein